VTVVSSEQPNGAASLTRWRALVLEPFYDLREAMDAHVVRAARPYASLALVLVSGVAAWFVYVPIHELLHALGCWVTGGTVTELQIAPEYGGTLFAAWLPFVVSGGAYAGRLSGFDTHGSDLVYLATDALPFLLSVLVGVPWLKICARLRWPVVLGPAFVLAMAPFYCVTGDYYEMGSILATRALTMLRGGDALAYGAVRSDDLFRLAGEFSSGAAPLIAARGETRSVAVVLIVISFLVGTVLALLTYRLGVWVARTAQRASGEGTRRTDAGRSS